MDGLFLKALVFAADKHKNQRRKDADASPYINHPIALANILVNEGGVTDINVLCGAILHDTIEDTETTKEELIQQFGGKITSIVLDETDFSDLISIISTIISSFTRVIISGFFPKNESIPFVAFGLTFDIFDYTLNTIIKGLERINFY